jgi:hypothetical protein
MKSSIVRTLLAVSTCALLSPVALLAQYPVTAKIPFDFTVGQQSFTSGDYAIRKLNDHTLLIQNSKTGVSAMTYAMRSEPSQRPDAASLIFHRYGERYFLSSIRAPEQGWSVPPSRAEHEVIAKMGAASAVGVAASMRPK